MAEPNWKQLRMAMKKVDNEMRNAKMYLANKTDKNAEEDTLLQSLQEYFYYEDELPYSETYLTEPYELMRPLMLQQEKSKKTNSDTNTTSKDTQ